MKYRKLLSLIVLLVFFAGCKKDEYEKFKKVPEYIAHPDRAHKPYFDAYDKTLQLWGVAYEELYITTSKGIAHVIMSGPKDGVPVVLLHGMCASSTMWYPNAKALAKQYRIFAIDLIIEPGKSYKTADFKNIDEVTAWYEELFWALKLESFHLIGTSRGGWLATDIALKSKRDIRSLILLSPVQTFMWIPPSTDLLKNIFNIFYSKEEGSKRTMGTLSKDPSKLDKRYLEQYRIALENDSLNKFTIQMKPFPNSSLRSLKMPVLVLIGDDDMFNTEHTLRLVERHIPKGKGEVIANSGHFLSVDQAATVNKKIVNFMKSIDEAR
ncbi:alpha/beta hydrolase [Aequorivita todarodis]|uniref:alpha/beta fold hydrolase n=1 Tax=Aequorivita todarodis TaxID=2036821 RepID=UPI00234FBAE9|nr:alpha/beta hydrolase [Aequorivita todarodis]MDC8000188.1 alpha/beta hydrolase [Aequorivita todarodis]